MKKSKRFKEKEIKEPIHSATTNFSQENVIHAIDQNTKVTISNRNNRKMRLLSNDSEKYLSQTDSLKFKNMSRNNEYDFHKNNVYLKKLGIFDTNKSQGSIKFKSKFQSNQFMDSRKTTRLKKDIGTFQVSNEDNKALNALEKYRSLNPTDMSQSQTFTTMQQIRTNAATSLDVSGGKVDGRYEEQAPLNLKKNRERPKTAKTRGVVQQPSMLESSLGALDPLGSKNHIGFNINISAHSSY